jgi:hypothetical protein
MDRDNIMDVFLTIIYFLMIIPFTAWHDEHYWCRIKIPEWLNILFLNQVKNESVPLVSFVSLVQFYLSLIVLSIIRIVNNGMNLSDLLYYYLLTPYILIVIPAAFIIDAVIGYKRRRNEKDLIIDKNKEKLKPSKRKRRKR